MRSASALFLASAAWATAGVATGAAAVEETRVRLEVQSAVGCASESELAKRVRARSPRIRFVQENADMAVRATFTEGRSGTVVGELKLIEGAQERHLRRLEASSCVDAIEGVALILAITLDPTASTDTAQGVPGGGAEPTQDGSSSEAKGSGPDVGQEPAATSRGENDDSNPTFPGFDDPTDDPFRTGPAQWHIAGFVAGEGSLGATPGLLPALTAYVRVGLDRKSLWSPAFVLGATVSANVEESVEGGTASFDVRALTFEACPLSLELAPIEARACASALWGRLTAVGMNTRNPTGTIMRPFAAVGPAGLFGWKVGSHVEVSGRLAARANLIRDEFEFRPTVFHTVAPMTFSASLGVGLYWP